MAALKRTLHFLWSGRSEVFRLWLLTVNFLGVHIILLTLCMICFTLGLFATIFPYNHLAIPSKVTWMCPWVNWIFGLQVYSLIQIMNLLTVASLLALAKQGVWLRDYQLILQEDTAPNCIYKINRSITYSHNGKRFIKRCRLQLSSWTLLKGVCNVQLWTNSVYLRTKLKFLYLSGSHQLYLLYRN